MRIYCVTFLLVLLTFNGFSQETEKISYDVSYDLLDLSDIDPAAVSSHVLGDEVAKKMVLFRERYTKIQEASPTSPVEKTIIVKPNIYNSIRKIEKYYSKGVKKNTIEKEKAVADFSYCLDVALCVSGKRTNELEDRLKKVRKNPLHIVEVLSDVELNFSDY